MERIMGKQEIEKFLIYLKQEERSKNTIAKYARDVKAFFAFVVEGEVTKETVLRWKEALMKTHAPASVNSMLAAVNCFFLWLGYPQYQVKSLKIQRAIFATKEKELTYEDYEKLVTTAEGEGNHRLALLLQTIGATGIRISELAYITVEAIEKGRATVRGKGKTRIVFLLPKLCKALKAYCKKAQIKQGVVFCTKSGNALDRSNIWKWMKALCNKAKVDPQKVFPHNLRHLFARSYYAVEKDLSRLADLLGHSNINTTRIYTMESGEVHEKQLARMGMFLGRGLGIKKTT